MATETGKTAGAKAHVVPAERGTFKSLLITNPNYFGTAQESGFPVVTEIAGDTTYEEIDCISYNPDLNLLEATISIKQQSGYGGGLCQAGSLEFIRFFLDYGSGWVDAGLATVEVHDLPEALDCFDTPVFPLSYSATVQLQPERQPCWSPVLPAVRAILSWSVIPTGPDFVPVWGDVTQCTIQIKPRPPFVLEALADISAEIKHPVKLPPPFAYAGHIPLPGPPPEGLDTAALARRYAPETETEVPAHRFGFSELAQAATSAKLDQETITQKIAAWEALGLSWVEAASALNETDADVSYEQLECVGLDNHVDRLVASFRVKLPYGYNGSLCQLGSTEYVAFWASGWDDSCGWTYLGTAGVAVHDISPLPEDGLCYAAILPVDLTHQRQPCQEPKELRIRAVLSWNVPPSTSDPDALPTWGNSLDTHVQAGPGVAVPPGTVTPLIGLIGGIPVINISPVTGLTTSLAAFALLGGSAPADPDGLGRPCPFAETVAIQGPSFPGYRYRIQVKRSTDVNWTTVNNSFTAWDETGTIATHQVASGDYFNYLPDSLNVDNLLAVWETAGNDLWNVKIDILGVAGSDVHQVQLHNSGLTASIDIEVFAGNCGKFPAGTHLAGKFVALDEADGQDYLAHS
ncbi:MAG TPA: hypothetical protein VGS62_05555, partial [Streptosporangiaceae bacterium]|nr:hypothetical protein [Streptosporangiaceae bacterium]